MNVSVSLRLVVVEKLFANDEPPTKVLYRFAISLFLGFKGFMGLLESFLEVFTWNTVERFIWSEATILVIP